MRTNGRKWTGLTARQEMLAMIRCKAVSDGFSVLDSVEALAEEGATAHEATLIAGISKWWAEATKAQRERLVTEARRVLVFEDHLLGRSESR